MKKYLLVIAVLFTSHFVNADDTTGKVFKLFIVGDKDPTVSIRGNIYVYIDDATKYYVISPTDQAQKNYLSMLMTAKTTRSSVHVLSDGTGPGTYIRQLEFL